MPKRKPINSITFGAIKFVAAKKRYRTISDKNPISFPNVVTNPCTVLKEKKTIKNAAPTTMELYKLRSTHVGSMDGDADGEESS